MLARAGAMPFYHSHSVTIPVQMFSEVCSTSTYYRYFLAITTKDKDASE